MTPGDARVKEKRRTASKTACAAAAGAETREVAVQPKRKGRSGAGRRQRQQQVCLGSWPKNEMHVRAQQTVERFQCLQPLGDESMGGCAAGAKRGR